MTTDQQDEALAYNQQDAARVMGVSDRTVRRWVASKVVRTVTIGSVELIPRSELLRAIDVALACKAESVG